MLRYAMQCYAILCYNMIAFFYCLCVLLLQFCGLVDQFGIPDGAMAGIYPDSKCVMYSIGSNGQFQFEWFLTQKTSCHNEIFDCTIKNTTLPHHQIRHRTNLHFNCLGAKTEKRLIDFDKYSEVTGHLDFISWDYLRQVTNTTGNTENAYLKMDIEGFEFEVVTSIMKSHVAMPNQMAIELHIAGMEMHYKVEKPGHEIAEFVRRLRDEKGYFIMDARTQRFGLWEVVFMKVDCSK
jgi:Methyltransferase domain